MGALTDFHPGTTKQFTVECRIDGVAQDIRSDTVTVTFKADRALADSVALLQVAADVTTCGDVGIAIFILTPQQTKLLPEGKMLYVDIKWTRDDDSEYVIYDERVKSLTRVSDVPADPPPPP